MLPTPSTSHINFDRVYEPAEDSFLLLDTLSSASEAEFLSRRFKHPQPSPLVVEVGTGSGVVLAFVTAWAKAIFGRRDLLTLGTDVNSFACRGAAGTVRHARSEALKTELPQCATFTDTLITDLTSSLRQNTVDVLIFNPPYVPSEDIPNLPGHEAYDDREEAVSKDFARDSHLLALSWAGGTDGMEITNRLLEQLPQTIHLERGVAYVLLCAQNNPDEVKERIRSWHHGWRAEMVGNSGKQGGWEKLQILRIWRDGPA